MSSPASSLPPHLHPPHAYPSAHSPKQRSRQSPASSPQQGNSPRSTPRSGSTGMLDVESVVKTHGGDARKALDGIVLDRNNLQAQNTQLWKLIEKQRAQCGQFAADNERLRQERDRAVLQLTAAGIEPVGNGRKINQSASATGLGIKHEIPQIRRNHSDRDDTFQAASRDRSGSAVSEQKPASGLLPSPIPDKKSRRESRMVFPPEVSSFMTLADSPQDLVHNGHRIPPIPSGNQSSTDPSPQLSLDSPTLNKRELGGVVPPLSSKALSNSVGSHEPAQESPNVRPLLAQRGSGESTKPHPSTTTSQMKSSSPSVRSGTMSPNQSISETISVHSVPSIDHMSRPSIDSSLSSPDNTTPRQSVDQVLHTQRQHHAQKQQASNGQPRLPPSLLPHSRITIPSSSIFPDSSGRDVLCFTIEIAIRSPNAQPVSWNVAKLFSAFLELDGKIKITANKSRKEWKSMVASLPDGRSWKDFAPSKVDQRKAALEAYLQSLLVAPISDKADLCRFLTTDYVQAKTNEQKREGYLTKKGKNFGGWKTRYFVLDGSVMEYYESRGGSHLGSIVITGAQIGRQNRPADSTDEKDFRHAFLIIEPGRKGTSQRHVLCAESDMERDRWIEILVRHVDPEHVAMPPLAAPAASPSVPRASSPNRQAALPFPSHAHTQNVPQSPAPSPVQGPAQTSKTQQLRRQPSQLRKHSKDEVVVTSTKPLALLHNAKFADPPSPSLFNSMETHKTEQAQSPVSYPSTQAFPVPHLASAPYPGQMSAEVPPPRQLRLNTSLQSLPEMTTSVHGAEPTPRANKRQSMVPGRSPHALQAPNFLTNAPPPNQSHGGLTPIQDKDRDRKAKSRGFWGFGKTPEKVSRPVFGTSLTDSISIASIANLPAILFRCIEWLEANKAENEEGIYRLSGSSAVIKGLKERFDAEGDINLLAADEHWDPHAIAGLLKTYLRDLPTSLLTRELHTHFLSVMDLVESSARITELSRLVSELPPPNYALLRALSAHLILVVQNSGVNKMTLRNIGIVFSPTLGIPAGIFSELISNFGPIFDDEGDPMDTRASTSERGSEVHEEAEDTVKRKRNSMLYQAGGVDTMLGLSGRHLDSTNEDSNSDESADDLESAPSSDIAHSTASEFPRPPEGQSSAAAVRNPKTAARGAAADIQNGGGGIKNDERRLTENSEASKSSARTPGLPGSPRPEMMMHNVGERGVYS